MTERRREISTDGATPRSLALLADWQIALHRQFKANIVGDLLTQVLLVPLWWFHLRSPWIVGLWLIKWLLVGALWRGLGLVKEHRNDVAVGVVVAAHWIGVITTSIVAPVMTPATALIVVGDLRVVAEFASGHMHRRLVRGAAISGVVVALALLQNRAALDEQVAQPLVVAFAVGQVIGVGVLMIHDEHLKARMFARRIDRIGESLNRLSDVDHDEIAIVQAAVLAGPLATLTRIERILQSLDSTETNDHVPEIIATAHREAAAATEMVRGLARGLYPPTLESAGLGPTIEMSTRSFSDRFDLSLDLAASNIDPSLLYAAAYEVVSFVRDRPPLRGSLSITNESNLVRLHVVIETSTLEPEYDLLLQRLNDWLGALGGAARSRMQKSGSWELAGVVPIASAPTHPNHDDSSTIRNLLRTSHLLALACSLGVLAVSPMLGSLGRIVAPTSLLVSVAFVLVESNSAIAERHRPVLLAVHCAVVAVVCGWLVPLLAPVLTVLASSPATIASAADSPHRQRVVGALQIGAGSVATAFLSYRSIGETFSERTRNSAVVLGSILLGLAIVNTGRACMVTADRGSGLVSALQSARQQLASEIRAARRRTERDLHDGAQQDLVALAAQLRTLAGVALKNAELARRALPTLQESVVSARSALTSLSAGMSPTVLTERGLLHSLRWLASRSHAAISVEIDERWDAPRDVQSAVYFCCSEALQNATKHGLLDPVPTLTVQRIDDNLVWEVTNARAAVAPLRTSGQGLANMRERMESVCGSLTTNTTAVTFSVCGRVPVHTPGSSTS